MPVLPALLLLALLLSPTVAKADVDCAKMKEFVEIMFIAGDFLNTHPNFDDNEELSKDIDDLIAVLKEISNQENMASLANSVAQMDDIWGMEEWTDTDRRDFITAMDATNVNLKRLYEQKCPN